MLAATMDRARVSLGLLLFATAVAGCAMKGKSAPDTATATEAPQPRDDELDARARELEAYEGQLRALGLAPTGDAAAGSDDEGMAMGGEVTQSQDRCERICALAEAICGIETSVCDLARAHPHERRYAEVCARAHDDCELATSACEECSGA